MPSADRTRGSAALLLLVAACVHPHGGPAQSPVSATELRSLARLTAMTDTRRLDTALVDSLLATHVPILRRQATIAIGQVGGRPRAARLRALLRDADTAVAANAAFALGLLHDTASIPALSSALAVAEPAAFEAAWALGEIGEPARSAIEANLDSRRVVSVHARAELLRAAGRLKPAATASIVRTLAATSSADSELQRAGAYAIARSRAPGGVRLMLAYTRSPDEMLREHSARALAIRAAGDSLADTAFAALGVLALDPRPHVRINALRSLSGYGPRARALLVAAAHDSDANVRITAAQSLVPPVALQRREWTALWNADTGFMYRRSLLASAMQSGTVLSAADEDNTERWQLQPDWRYRAAVAEAGAAAPQVELMRDVSLPLTRDRDGRVRAAAYAALAPWLDSADADAHRWRRDLMVAALTDEDPIVRATALGALGGKASAAELTRVVAEYRMSLADTLNDARLAGINYIAAAWRRDSVAFGDSLRSLIASLRVPNDPLVRAAARGITPIAAWSATEVAARPIEWYEEQLRATLIPTLAAHPPIVELRTERGIISLELFGADAPITVANFCSLVRRGYYADTRFHRVVPGFVAQDGDPRGDGSGGPGYPIRDELNRRRYDRAVLGMALSGPDTGGSQYFITLAPQPHLDGHYTVFGRVRSGFDVLDALVQGDRILEIRVR